MFRVRLTASARRQAIQIADWWAENRLDSKGLFVDELRAAIDQLANSPHSGQAYEAHGSAPSGVRRLLLWRSHFHVYYSVGSVHGLVVVRAIWHASRGRGPAL